MNILKYAGAYIALEIGSGFATGQEIKQFFASYGVWGFGSILLSMTIFAWIGKTVMTAGFVHRSEENIRPYRLFCGERLGRVYEIFVILYLFAMLAVMLSGAGASLQEYLGVEYYVGGIIMAVIVFLSFACGLEKLIHAVGMIGPLIVVVTVVVAIGTVLSSVGELDVTGGMSELQPVKSWWLSGILYASYNLVSSLAFLMALGRDAASVREAAVGGIVGGIVLMVTAGIMSLALLCRPDLTTCSQVPSLELAEALSPLMGKAFLCVMFLGIFSTAAPMLWTVVDGLTGKNGRWSRLLAFLLTLDALLLGQFPFDRLVAWIYPYTGYLGILLLLCIWMQKRAVSNGSKR